MFFRMKQNANEYLEEYSKDKENWLKILIDFTITTNGNVSQSDLDSIYESMLTKKHNSKYEYPEKPENEAVKQPVYLSKLTHNTGVNALKSAESIKFSDDVTVLYGFNGSGKSGYFRILNEIAGGDQPKEILSNIYNEDYMDVDVDIEYIHGEEKEHIKWKNDYRPIPQLAEIKVFDSTYKNGLLTRRTTDETIIEPLGLHLFSYLITILDDFKNKLEKDKVAKQLSKPQIQLDKLSESIRNSFENHSFTEENQKKIENLYSFDEKQRQNLKEKIEKIKSLQQMNYGDKITLQKNISDELINIKTKYKESFKNLNVEIDNIKSLLTNHKELKKASEQYRESISALQSLPGTDTESWKRFISTGKEFSNELENSKEICIYCRQPLDENAMELIQSYSEYISNEAEKDLKKNVAALSTEKEIISNLILDFNPGEEVKKLLKEKKIFKNKSLYDLLCNLLKNFQENKTKLLNHLHNFEYFDDLEVESTNNAVKQIDELADKINKNIDQLSKQDSQKSKKIEELQKEVQKLEENKSIFEQQENIKCWFQVQAEEMQLEDAKKQINTRGLSTLSKKASNDLLTESLKTYFIEELNKLGRNKFNVDLVPGGITKGRPSTKFIINKNEDILSILSEGEQKTIALALFIAESKIHERSNPIIFDDPVNSLDHTIASDFAHRLLALDKQVVVFTHNKLFMDAFTSAKNGHICKTVETACNKQGKHILHYYVESEGKFSKGVIQHQTETNAKSYIKESEKLLEESPFTKADTVAVKIRKSIECIVDEIVLFNQVPTKLSNKNSRIHWENLKKLNPNEDLIDSIRYIHDRVSGGDMHKGTESEENPIDKEEFLDIINKLKKILSI